MIQTCLITKHSAHKVVRQLRLVTMETHSFLNSDIKSVIHKNTPIKRLGLSRKRKSCGSQCSVNAKLQARSEKTSDSPTQSEKYLLEKQAEPSATNIEDEDATTLNYDEEIELLKQRILEDEEKLKALKCNKNDVNQLEELIELWKNGCKNAFLHLSQLLKDRQSENIDFKSVLNKLGVWKTMLENFESDSEISLSEYSQ